MCIGNQLARAELRAAFSQLTRRVKNIRASRGEDSYAYTTTYVSYGLTKLWISFRQEVISRRFAGRPNGRACMPGRSTESYS